MIKGLHDYNLESTHAGKWNFNIAQGKELLTDEVEKGIADFKEDIYFNDLSSKHWIFDFKVNNVWIEAVKIDCINMMMDLALYQ